MDRRGALKGILSACSAPYFVPVERLMRIKPIVVASPWMAFDPSRLAFVTRLQLEYNRKRVHLLHSFNRTGWPLHLLTLEDGSVLYKDAAGTVIRALPLTSEPQLLSAPPSAASPPP